MGSGPKPPDPYATAQAQGNENYKTAQMNTIMGNVNEYTPYGSKTYKQVGWSPVYDSSGRKTYAPRYQSTVALSPDQQKLLSLQTGMQQNLGQLGLSQSSRLQDLLGKEMNTEGLQAWQAANAPGQVRQDQGPTDRAAIEDAMMASYSRAADPRNQQQMTQLANRGLSPGGQGYADVARQQGDEFGEQSRQAYLRSGEESRQAQNAYNAAGLQQYQMGSDYASQLNNLRQSQLQERMAIRNQPINEIMALLGGSGVTTPQFQPFQSSNIAPVNIGQMIYDDFNAQAQQSAAKNQGLFGLAGAGLSALTMPMGGMLGR